MKDIDLLQWKYLDTYSWKATSTKFLLPKIEAFKLDNTFDTTFSDIAYYDKIGHVKLGVTDFINGKFLLDIPLKEVPVGFGMIKVVKFIFKRNDKQNILAGYFSYRNFGMLEVFRGIKYPPSMIEVEKKSLVVI